ncbi:MAG: hypothetical protein ACLFO1_04925 [Spirochaetaceae bacterium]
MAGEYTETRTTRQGWLKQQFQDEGVDFTRDDGWETLAEHIEVHQYLLSQELGFAVTWEEAMFSWYENVYTPLKRATESWVVRRAFPKQRQGDLILAVSDHWHYLKQQDENTMPEEAARSFVEHYGSGLARFFSPFIVPEYAQGR